MKIGIFDSGLGGLFLMEPVVEALPQYDYVYFGDTANLPYGDKSQEQIYIFTKRALDYLFAHDCAIVFIFCNTASARALRKLQHGGYRALGIIIPTVEEIIGKRIGILATQSTVDSGKYPAEIKKLFPNAKIFQQAAPKLVPMIESGVSSNISYEKILDIYLQPLFAHNIDTLILGCTHYGILKKQIRAMMPEVKVISQDEIIADKVAGYLARHQKISNKLSRGGTREYFSTSHHPGFQNLGNFDRALFRLVVLHDSHNGPADR